MARGCPMCQSLEQIEFNNFSKKYPEYYYSTCFKCNLIQYFKDDGENDFFFVLNRIRYSKEEFEKILKLKSFL